MENSELVIELGVEEIPASMLEDAARQFSTLLVDLLKAQRLPAAGCKQWFTPRRIIVGFDAIPIRQEDLVEDILGPPQRIAYVHGEPTRATLAFAQITAPRYRNCRWSKPKGEYVC
jgi:glycyl-tRNA synthetase beta chain